MERFDGNFCKFFQEIRKDPYAITPRLTVGEFLAAKEHVKTCKECDDIINSVLADAPPEEISDNISPN